MRPLGYVLSGVLVAGLLIYTAGPYFPMGNAGGAGFFARGNSSKGSSRNSSRFFRGKNGKQNGEPRRVNPYPIPKRIDIGHIEGKGIGYERGYTKLSVVFGPEYEIGHTLPLLDLRGVVFDDGSLAANAAIIVRFLPKTLCEVFGLNISYDFREGKYGNFNQVSGGFEVLHRRFELHANARAPVGTKRHRKKTVCTNFIGPFFEACTKHQYAEYAFDADAGYYLVNGKDFQLYAAAGPYYLAGHKTAVGGRAVLRPQFKDYLAVELSVSHDRIFETIFQANVILTIPLYNYSSALKHKRGPCDTANRQIYQPLDRDVVLFNGRRCCKNNFGCPSPVIQ